MSEQIAVTPTEVLRMAAEVANRTNGQVAQQLPDGRWVFVMVVGDLSEVPT